jgi:hypothetical protein
MLRSSAWDAIRAIYFESFDDAARPVEQLIRDRMYPTRKLGLNSLVS